jgi:hypothetical protein
MYGLTNSLAQSTFDTRNIGMVSRGMASAGMGMGTGSTNNYDKNLAGKQERFSKKLNSIKDGSARQEYLEQTRNGVGSRFGKVLLGKSDGEIITEKVLKARKNTTDIYNAMPDGAKKMDYYNNHKTEIDAELEYRKRVPVTLKSEEIEGAAKAPDADVIETPPQTPTTTDDGSMPKTQSSPEYAPVTAKTDATKVEPQHAPMSDAEATEREMPAFMRNPGETAGAKVIHEGGASATATPAEGSEKPGFMMDAVEKINHREALANRKAGATV